MDRLNNVYMDRLKEKLQIVQIASVIIPLLLSVAFIFTKKYIFLMLAVISLFMIVGFCPLFRKRENLWMFILSGVAGLPLNVYLAYSVIFKTELMTIYSAFNICSVIVLSSIFFGVEEIVLAVITRIIWKRQYKWPDID